MQVSNSALEGEIGAHSRGCSIGNQCHDRGIRKPLSRLLSKFLSVKGSWRSHRLRDLKLRIRPIEIMQSCVRSRGILMTTRRRRHGASWCPRELQMSWKRISLVGWVSRECPSCSIVVCSTIRSAHQLKMKSHSGPYLARNSRPKSCLIY